MAEKMRTLLKKIFIDNWPRKVVSIILAIIIILLYINQNNDIEEFNNCRNNNSSERLNSVTVRHSDPDPTDEMYKSMFDYSEPLENQNGSRRSNISFQQIEKENALNNINAQLLNDILFRDVIVYQNDPDGRSGLDKCLDNKTGTCVPWGVSTGIAWYYPPDVPYDYYGEVINSTLTPLEKRESTIGTISYPNLR